jgi:1-acyl-sn-glycerol-3-phosphate acyltransferase
MRLLKYLVITVWRIWFYCWVIGTIIIAFPILLLVTSKEGLYPYFYKIARFWGKTILFVMGFRSQVKSCQKLDLKKSYMFCANHTSMIDIMLMLSVVKNPLVFVGKVELSKIPLFGFFYKRTCILVDRSSISSRKRVFAEAERRLKNGYSVCIFPEGGVPDDENIILDQFKNGAFALAIEHKIPVVPMSFYDCKKKFSYTFLSGSPGLLRVQIHEFVETSRFSLLHRKILRDDVFNTIYNDLFIDNELFKKMP